MLAPLHMPHMVRGIEAFMKLIPGKPMVAIFDTAFHQTMPEKAFLYAIPYEYYLKYGIRRYGFHGTSHKYVANQAAKLIGEPYESIKIITCHLGNGSSITAVNNGKSVDTSMGFTPMAGVPMGTRCGDIDAAIVGFLMRHENITYTETESILNQQSGFLGISGLSNDCRVLEKMSVQGDTRAKAALEVFCYQIQKYIGAYTAAMNGLDCIVFTGGIGENSASVRKEICTGIDYLGIHISQDKNEWVKSNGGEGVISTDQSKVKICVIRTNEELMIAKESVEVLRLKQAGSSAL